MSGYLGDEKFASGGGTTTVTAHQFTNNTSDIKPDGASASLGVLDTIVRADHVHPFSDAETFAESERTKSNNASYGAIVHQKEMESYAQPLVKTEGLIDISSLTYTTLDEFVDYFRQNYPKGFHVPIGASDSANSFKTLVGVPIGFNYYGGCIITPIIGNESGDGSDQVFKLYAYESYSTEFAVGYIVVNYPATSAYVHFTGWEYPKNGQVEHTVTIYDKDSADADINWGYTSGLQDNTTLANKDFSGYKGLYIYTAFWGETCRFYLSLETRSSNGFFCSGYTNLTKNVDGYDSVLVYIYNSKTSITTTLKFGIDSWTSGGSGAYIYKIEGVV